MQNMFEQRDQYMYTEYVGEHLDLGRIIGWVTEFLEHPKFVRSAPVLWNALSINSTDLSFGDMQKFGDFILDIREKRGSGRSAFVSNDDLIFGLFRTHEMLNHQKYDYDYHVFRELSAATKWVLGE